MSGLKQNVCCVNQTPSHVRITSSYSHLHNTTNSTTELSKVGAQLLEWLVTLNLYLRQNVQVWGNGCTHYLPTQHWVTLKSFSWGTLISEKHQALLDREL